MKIASAAVVAVFSLSGWALAAPATPIPPEIDVMQRIASDYDDNEDGRISLEEFQNFTQTAWRSMDTDASGDVSQAEFMAWDPGFSFVAHGHGKAEDFTTLKQEIFAYWDGNDDGIATKDEVMAVAEAEFANSDADGDGFVTGRDLAFGSPTFAAFIFGAGPGK